MKYMIQLRWSSIIEITIEKLLLETIAEMMI